MSLVDEFEALISDTSDRATGIKYFPGALHSRWTIMARENEGSIEPLEELLRQAQSLCQQEGIIIKAQKETHGSDKNFYITGDIIQFLTHAQSNTFPRLFSPDTPEYLLYDMKKYQGEHPNPSLS